LTVLFMQTMFS